MIRYARGFLANADRAVLRVRRRLSKKRTSKFSVRRRPGAIDDLERATKPSQEPQAPLYEGAIRDTVERFEATGSPVVIDGEQRKHHNFCTSARMAWKKALELGLVLGGR